MTIENVKVAICASCNKESLTYSECEKDESIIENLNVLGWAINPRHIDEALCPECLERIRGGCAHEIAYGVCCDKHGREDK